MEINKEEDIKFELDNGSGIVLIDNINEEEFINISKYLGKFQIQNIQGDKIVTIKDIGSKLSSGRYHQSNAGDSYHTDCPQWDKVVNYLGMYCVMPAVNGGDSKLVNAKDVYNKMEKESPKLLKVLFDNFYFDKREYIVGESKTILKPIFSYIDDKLCFRYLKEYVISGHEIENKPLSETQKLALSKLDDIIHDENLIMSLKLKKNQAIFVDNQRIIHGRSSFIDSEIKR